MSFEPGLYVRGVVYHTSVDGIVYIMGQIVEAHKNVPDWSILECLDAKTFKAEIVRQMKGRDVDIRRCDMLVCNLCSSQGDFPKSSMMRGGHPYRKLYTDHGVKQHDLAASIFEKYVYSILSHHYFIIISLLFHQCFIVVSSLFHHSSAFFHHCFIVVSTLFQELRWEL